jgi:glucose/arabinose dehydrogenase
MARGPNILEFVALLNGLESERSDPLAVVLARATATVSGGLAGAPRGGAFAATIATGLQSPTDLALLPDGRLLIAERVGRVRVVEAGRLLDTAALVLDDVAVANDFGLFAVAAHPDFARNRFVYLAYTARLADGAATYRVVRAREVNNTLGELAVVLNSIPASAPAWISARFGPDRKLYVGVAACADCGSPYAGAILRLNDDGSTPRDNRSASPFYSGGLGLPVGLAWTGSQLWIADWHPGATSVVRTAEGRRHVLGAAARPGGLIARQSSAGSASTLWLARVDGAGIQQFRVGDDGGPPLELAAPLLDESNAAVQCIGEARDGTVYLCVSDPDARDGTARLMRVSGRQ